MLLSAPRPWKSRGDLLLFALFIVPVSLFAIGHKFNLRVLSSNAAMLVAVLPWCWLVWQLMGGSLLLLTGLILAMVAMMIYWVAALSGVGGSLGDSDIAAPAGLIGRCLLGAGGAVDSCHRRTTERVPIERPRDAGASNGHLVFPGHSGCCCRSIHAGTSESQIWSAVSLTIVGVLLSAVIPDPLRRFLLEWGNLTPNPNKCPEQQNTPRREE